uniref:Uncharacterized protein n=1 Tax=Tanacetum cinerariifolium TaxID=118510 RepID=A0A6L2NI81_TANCI|nr:hypothetical protein [Tanacetum cinerariifolium]
MCYDDACRVTPRVSALTGCDKKDLLVKAKATTARLANELDHAELKLSEQALVMRNLENKLVLDKSESQSDKFNATLARILSFGITSGVERGLRMGCFDVEFQDTFPKVSNFILGAKAEFKNANDDLPFTHFPFLAKIFEAADSTLSKVVSIQPDKLAHPAVSTSVPATSSLADKMFGWTSTPKDYEPTGLSYDAFPSLV